MGRLAWGLGAMAILAGLAGPGATGEESRRVDHADLLSTDRVGARDFVRAHPEWDGRGVVVAVLDTGVDPSVPGLAALPQGGPKVIEARDFTGQGTVKLRRPEVKTEGPEEVLATGSGVLRGHRALTPAPVPESLLMGFLEEARFRSSEVDDLNANGRSDDTFALLAGEIAVEGGREWRLWVDRDGDGHVDDEAPIRSYGVAQEHFVLAATADQAGGTAPMALAATLLPQRREVEIHTPDGSHGTHVAGIAAGWRLYGREGFDGIAPGARVMSLKIGDNTLSGGSTRSGSMAAALRFAGEWSRDHATPVVVNMSYGIGTEAEGASDVDRLVDRLLAEFPLLAVATSAGNSGPGLSTVGTPAGADFAFAAGAVLTTENARTLYDAAIPRDAIFSFSSRGGELAKPDGVAPGVAASTVPSWEWGIVMRGTSMASPQAAGCMALLASAARGSSPPLPVTGGLLRLALRNSGRPLEGYTLPDQGPGMIHVPRAWEALKRLAAEATATRVLGYQVRGTAPGLEDDRGPAAFFRTGTWFPAEPERVPFEVRPVFFKDTSDADREAFFEVFDLVVEAPWLTVDRRALFLRRDEPAEVFVGYDPRRLTTPGVHSARIRGVYRGGGRGQENTAFELWSTVVVPWVFDLTQGLERTFESEVSRPGESRRYFLRVPEGAAAMHLSITPAGRYTSTRLDLFDPRGTEIEVPEPRADSATARTARIRVAGEELVPGVWELVATTEYEARADSTFDVRVSFSGFHWKVPEILDYAMGEKPRGSLTLRATLDRHFRGRAEGEVQGFWRRKTWAVEGDELSIPVAVDPDAELLTFRLTLSPAQYARFTDLAVNLLSPSGRVVEKGGFSSRTTTLQVSGPAGRDDGTSYTLQVLGALTDPEDGEPWEIELEETVRLRERPELEIWCDGSGLFELFPGQEKSCELELAKAPPTAPEGWHHHGEVRLRDDRGRGVLVTIPLRFRIR